MKELQDPELRDGMAEKLANGGWLDIHDKTSKVNEWPCVSVAGPLPSDPRTLGKRRRASVISLISRCDAGGNWENATGEVRFWRPSIDRETFELIPARGHVRLSFQINSRSPKMLRKCCKRYYNFFVFVYPITTIYSRGQN